MFLYNSGIIYSKMKIQEDSEDDYPKYDTNMIAH